MKKEAVCLFVERGSEITNDDIKHFITLTLDAIRKHENDHARIAALFKNDVFMMYSFLFLSNGMYFTINNACAYSKTRIPFVHEMMQFVQFIYDIFQIARKKSKVLYPCIASYKETL